MRSRFAFFGGLFVLAGVSGSLASAAGANSWEELAAQWLDAAFHQPGGRWTATVLAAPPGWDSALAKNQVRITGVAEGVAKPKKIMVLAMENAGALRGTLKIQTLCSGAVPVANRLLTRGQLLTPADWHWEQLDLGRLPADALRLEKDLAGKRVKNYINAREILTAHVLEPKPDVAKGARLTLRVAGDGVVINTDAEALEEGYVGRGIRLRVEDNGKIVTASVAGPENAELVLNNRR